MGERKVVNKYYPPDFDPVKIPRRRTTKNKQINIRMMLPMRIQCNTCGSYISEGTKFNSRKEDVIGERYKSKIQIFRFYIKCNNCSAEITLKTDPKHDDYEVEFGATRRLARVEDDVGKVSDEDAMKTLEDRRLVSKREIDIHSTLDELKSMKSRRARVSVDALFEALQSSYPLVQEKRFQEDDEAYIKFLFRGSKRLIQRIDDDVLEDVDITKNVKLSQQVYDKPIDHVTKTTREESRGRIVLKSSTIQFSVKKKSS